MFRKVIRIRAADSPNVKSGKHLFPGVITLEEYEQRRRDWDQVRQCIGLDAEFYKGPETLLFPPAWLNAAEVRHEELKKKQPPLNRQGLGLGIDPGEGGAETAWAVVDEWGLLKMVAHPTPDTNVIPGITIALGREYGVSPENWVFDRGGGGLQHADALRAKGYAVRSVGFGESPHVEPHYGTTFPEQQLEIREERYAYLNLRAQLYHEASLLFDPSVSDDPRVSESRSGNRGIASNNRFALPVGEVELKRQLSLIPLWRDGEGRLFLPPKQRRPDATTRGGRRTLVEIVGCSPDRADAFVLAIYALLHPGEEEEVGALW